MYAFVNQGVQLNDLADFVRLWPPAAPGITVFGDVVARSLRELAEVEGDDATLALCRWFPIDLTAVDPGETATDTRDVVYRVTNLSPIEVSRLYEVRPKTQEELDQDAYELSQGGRKTNLSNILSALQVRSAAHAQYAADAAGLNNVNNGNNNSVTEAMVRRQEEVDVWFSQLYDRLEDLIRYLRINA